MNKNNGMLLILGLIVFSVFVMEIVSAFEISDYVSGDWREIILLLIVIVIMFAVLYDITMFIPFISSDPVRYVIAAGLTLAAILMGWLGDLLIKMLKIAAVIGAFGIFGLIIITLIIVFGLFAGITPYLEKWAQKIKAGRIAVQAMKAADEAAAGINEARRFGKATRQEL